MSSAAPVMAQARGGLSLSPHDAPEQRLRAFEKSDRDRKMREEPPLTDLKPTHRVFRIPDKVGRKFVTNIVRAVKDVAGNETSPASSLVIQFTPCPVAERCGEIVLDSANPLDARRIQYIENLMLSEPHHGIFDFLAGREKAEQARLADDARKMAEPGYLDKLVAHAQALGVDMAGNMAAAVSKLRRPPAKPEAPPSKAEA